MRRSTVILSVICLILFIFTSATSFCLLLKINKLELHHVEKYEKYSYAYDCIKEAELSYWDTKAELTNEIQNYIDKVAPTSNLRGYAIVEECEKYNVDICFVLAQGELESHFGTTGVAAKTNMVWNVGAFDGKSAEEIIKDGDYNIHPNESIGAYLEELMTNWMVNKTEYDLMQKYVNTSGKRYASNPNYEIILQDKYNKILESTRIQELSKILKNYAIKCGRNG